MKKLLILCLFTVSILTYGQEEKTFLENSKNRETKVTSFKCSVNSLIDFENINWEDVRSSFDSKKPEGKIAISLALDLKESKYKFKGLITFADQTKNIDSLIESAKKSLQSLIRISKKHQNK
jgi:hypothetical protein